MSRHAPVPARLSRIGTRATEAFQFASRPQLTDLAAVLVAHAPEALLRRLVDRAQVLGILPTAPPPFHWPPQFVLQSVAECLDAREVARWSSVSRRWRAAGEKVSLRHLEWRSHCGVLGVLKELGVQRPALARRLRGLRSASVSLRFSPLDETEELEAIGLFFQRWSQWAVECSRLESLTYKCNSEVVGKFIQFGTLPGSLRQFSLVFDPADPGEVLSVGPGGFPLGNSLTALSVDSSRLWATVRIDSSFSALRCLRTLCLTGVYCCILRVLTDLERARAPLESVTLVATHCNVIDCTTRFDAPRTFPSVLRLELGLPPEGAMWECQWRHWTTLMCEDLCHWPRLEHFVLDVPGLIGEGRNPDLPMNLAAFWKYPAFSEEQLVLHAARLPALRTLDLRDSGSHERDLASGIDGKHWECVANVSDCHARSFRRRATGTVAVAGLCSEDEPVA